MNLDHVSDKDIVNFYRTEYFNEWRAAIESKMFLSAKDIRERLKDISVL
jgi:hypothetical protein